MDSEGLIRAYSVVLPLDDLVALCGLGRHLQPAGGACLQLLDLPPADADKSEECKSNGVSGSPGCQQQQWLTIDSAHLGWDKFTNELDAVSLHVLAGAVRHFLVEASQQDGSNHDGDVKAEACQETTALQSYVRCPDHQGLPRAVGQREEVIAGGQKDVSAVKLQCSHAI